MTVFNISKMIDFETMQILKKYLNVNKLSLRYSEWLNDFGLYTKEPCDKTKKERCLKYLIKKYKLNDCKISILTSYPIVKRRVKRCF